MAEPASSPAAGGFPIAIGALAGAGVGFARGETTIGFLAGLALGAAIALAVWLKGRR